MSVEDQLAREAVRDLLKEINKKVFTQKKEAIGKFVSYIESAQPKMTASTIELLLAGERKYLGILSGIGAMNWKGAFQKYTSSLLDLLQFLLSGQFEQCTIAQRVFLSLDPSLHEAMCLNLHTKKKSGHEAAATWILKFLSQNGREVKDALPTEGKKNRRPRRSSAESVSNLTQASTSDVVLDLRSTSRSSISAIQYNNGEDNVISDSKKKKGFMKFLTGFFGRRPNQISLEKKGILKSAKIFGQPLDEVIQNYGKNGIPNVVVDCVEHLKRDHLMHEGLFRIPGNNTNIIALKQKYDYGDTPDLSKESANDVSGLLKLYFRDLPQPLFSWDKYDDLLKAHDALSTDNGESLRKVTSTCPENRKRLMKFLFEFLHLLSLNHAVNKMKPRNIAICLAPNLIRPEVETLQSVAQDSSAVTGIIRFFIEDAARKDVRKAKAILSAEANVEKNEKFLRGIENKEMQPSHKVAHFVQPEAATNTRKGALVAPDDSLPLGWRQCNSNGKIYYYNEMKNYTQWGRPTQAASVSEAPNAAKTGILTPRTGSQVSTPKVLPSRFSNRRGSRNSSTSSVDSIVIGASRDSVSSLGPIEEELPDGWTSHIERRSMKVYYYHAATKTSQWTKPV